MLDEQRETGSLQLSVYGAYWRAFHPPLSMAILIALLLMQSSRNLSDWWMSYWVSHNGSNPFGPLAGVGRYIFNEFLTV